jgi:hypothetical protein
MESQEDHTRGSYCYQTDDYILLVHSLVYTSQVVRFIRLTRVRCTKVHHLLALLVINVAKLASHVNTIFVVSDVQPMNCYWR